MRSAAQRIDAYNARMVSSQIDPVLTAVETQQQANFAGYIAEFYPFQVALRAFFDATPGAGVNAFGYEAFNNEVYSAYRRFSGAAFNTMVTTLADKYESLGLTRAHLVSIALNVWSIVIV